MPTENASATIAAPKRGKKYFTVAEANRALLYVSRIVDDLTSQYRQAVSIRQRLERPVGDDDAEELRDRYEQTMSQLNSLIDELQAVGVELKDFEKGLLDFPALHEGREIYLCWHRGEDRIHCWHEIDAGFAGRKDVATLVEAHSTAVG